MSAGHSTRVVVVSLAGGTLVDMVAPPNQSLRELRQHVTEAGQASRLLFGMQPVDDGMRIADLDPGAQEVCLQLVQFLPAYRPSLSERGVEFKVVIVGEWGVGKSTLLQQTLCDRPVERRYISKFRYVVERVPFATNCGLVVLTLWDSAGQEKFGSLRDSFVLGAQAAILMFDVTSRASYRAMPAHHRDVSRLCGAIPVAMVGNKADAQDRKVLARSVHPFLRKRCVQYYEVSALKKRNIEKPFLWLARRLTGQPALQFVGQFAEPPQACGQGGHPAEDLAALEAAQRTPVMDFDGDL